jgi:hypothetical protein
MTTPLTRLRALVERIDADTAPVEECEAWCAEFDELAGRRNGDWRGKLQAKWIELQEANDDSMA